MSEIENKAKKLTWMTIADLRCAMDFENNLDILKLALKLAENGAGYGSGKTSIKIIQARIRKLEKKGKP